MSSDPLQESLPLNQAPFNLPLTLEAIASNVLAEQFRKLGLELHSEIIRLDETLAAQTLRVSGSNGAAVLSSGMGLKTIVHLEDDRRIPLHDMEPGEKGHLEGTTGGHEFVSSLALLGFKENDPITLIRKLPPMEYVTKIDHGMLLRLSEGDAAHILGEINGTIRQFSLAAARIDFTVRQLLGGKKATARLVNLGLSVGSILTLVEVRSTQMVKISGAHQLMITSRDGLHLHLPTSAGTAIMVRLKQQNNNGQAG